MGRADHPLLGATVGLAGDGGGLLFTARLGLDTHPWLADHAVMGTTLLPGTAFVELALHAALELGCDGVSELVLEAPLLLSGIDAVQLQIHVAEPNELGERPIDIYSRPHAATVGRQGGAGQQSLQEEHAWTRHATGTLGAAAAGEERDPRGAVHGWRDAGGFACEWRSSRTVRGWRVASGRRHARGCRGPI